MNRQDFLASLNNALQGLPQNDIEKSLEYYSEIIYDQMEDGQTEEAAVATLGNPDDIAKQILMDTTLPKLVKAKVKSTRTLRMWEIMLLILGSPIWASLLLAGIILLLALYITVWSVIISLYAVSLSFAVGTLTGIVEGCINIFTGTPANAAFYIGAAIACFGATVLSFFACNKITAALIHASKQFIRWIKSLFVRKQPQTPSPANNTFTQTKI